MIDFNGHTNGAGHTSSGPTKRDPLRGLEALAKVALIGGDRIQQLAAQPVVYIWKDIAVAAIIVLLAGGPGEGKTTLLFLILVARMNVGAAVSLLGRRIEPAPAAQYVVLIEGEHGEPSAARKLVATCHMLGVDLACLDRIIIVARKAVRLGSPEWLDVVTMVGAGLVSDIALDTVARVAPGDADNERDQVAIFEIVAQAIEAAPDDMPKPVAWAVAHTRKNSTTGDLADVSGSAQRTGQADTVLLVKGKRVDGRVISSKVTFAKLREEPDDYPIPVTFTIERDPSGARRVVTTDETEEQDDRPLEARIREHLRSGPKTKTRLTTLLGRSDKDVDKAITALFAERAITTSSVVVRGRHFKAFALRENPQSTPDSTPDSRFVD